MSETASQSENQGEAFRSITTMVAEHMSEEITSGRIASKFGPKYTARNLARLADTMRQEVLELTPGSGQINKKRKAALEEEARRKQKRTPDYNFLGTILPNSFEPDIERRIYPFESFVNSAFYSYFVGNNPTLELILATVSVEMDADNTASPGEEMFRWQLSQNKGEEKDILRKGDKVIASVYISNKTLPATQEEYFHAAQELSLGTVEGVKYLDKRVFLASKHATHGSILIDRVLSSAAAQIGPQEFNYWSSKADSATAEFEKRHLLRSVSKWDKTPLGKTVNKRFQYPVVDYRELGAMIYNYSRDIDAFLFNKNGSINENNEALFELLSLQFGPLHRDLCLALVDVTTSPPTADGIPDFENLGRQLVEWGKRALRYYKGRPEEAELVTHHTDMQAGIDVSNLKYEISKDLISSINSQALETKGIPTTEITLKALAKEARRNATAKAKRLMQAVRIDNSSASVEIISYGVLRELGISLNEFNKLIDLARGNYRQHLEINRGMTQYSSRFSSDDNIDIIRRAQKSRYIKDMLSSDDDEIN